MKSGMTSTGPDQGGAPGKQPRSEKPPGDRPFFGRVESLRGLGAMAVAGYHISGCPLHGAALFPVGPWDGTGTRENVLRRLGLVMLPGHAALMLFFVISGFVLRLSLEYGPQKVSPAAAKFFLARIFRVYPIVVFGVLLIAGLAVCQAASQGQIAIPFTVPQVLANMLLLDVSMNGVLWALQCEMLMVPVIFSLYFLERRCGPRVLLGIALVTTALAFRSHWAGWPPLSTNVFPFVLGMVVPTLGRRFALSLSKRAATFWALGTVAALLLPGPCFGLYSRYSAVTEAYAAVLFVSLVAYRHDLSLLKCLDVRGLRLLGLSSGSYYVLHMATLPMALAIATAIVPPTWSSNAPGLVGPLVIAAWLVGIAPLMVCISRLVEMPGIALGRRVIRFCRVEARPVAAPGPERVAARVAA